MATPFRRYLLITDSCRHNPNPGDVLIGKGIQWLLDSFERQLDRVPLFGQMNIFGSSDAEWQRAAGDADVIVLCGTPQLGTNLPSWFARAFYRKLQEAGRGKLVLNLWPGIVEQHREVSYADSIARLVEQHRSYLNECWSPTYDMIVPRCGLTHDVLARCGVGVCPQLLDSVAFAPRHYGIEPAADDDRDYDAVVVARIGEENNVRTVKAVRRIVEQLDHRNSRPTWVLCHSIGDWLRFRDELPGTICINTCRDLLEFYSRAKRVVSLRVHGSVAAAALGCRVQHVRVDSRSNALGYMKIPTTVLEDFHELSRLKTQRTDQVAKLIDCDAGRFWKLYDLLDTHHQGKAAA